MVVSLILIGLYFLFGDSLGVSSLFLLVFLPVLCILLCRVYLCRGVRAPLGDVSHQGSRTGHVDSRIRSVDRNVPDRTVDPLDAPEPYPRRNILPVRPHVRAVYADCLETRAGDYREVAGGD